MLQNLPGGMQGVAMVAHSPLRHDNGLKSIESYHHQSWKQIPEYPSTQQEEINHNSFPSLVSNSTSTERMSPLCLTFSFL